MNVEVNKETNENITVNVENVKGTPFHVVEIHGAWKIAYKNNIISLKDFTCQQDAIKYVYRMDTMDVINALLLIIENK
jgi:hypothetical protein